MTSINTTMLTEKYRPETLEDIRGHDSAVTQFEAFLDRGMPHVLLSGPPGVGKTAIITAFARDLYGDSFQSNFREFNASDERGIDVVRDKIKSWCRSAPAEGADYKIVFLDESDSLTSEAQAALRRVMEQYSDVTRFALSCNYSTELIGPLQSRCATMYFGRLDDEVVEDTVRDMAAAESIGLPSDRAVDKLVRSASGQLRDAIMSLELSTLDNGKLTEENVDLYTGVVNDKLVRDILEQALQGEVDAAQTRMEVEVLKGGADPHELIDSINRVLGQIDMPPDSRVKCWELLAEIEERVKNGLNPHVQFNALLGHVYMAQGLSSISQQGGN